MKKCNWCNAMLVAYSSLPQIVKDIERSIDLRVKSGFGSRHLYYGISTEELLTGILNLNQRKIRLINIKVLVDKSLQALSEREQEFIKLKFFIKKPLREVAERLGVSLRTAFRIYDRVMERVEYALHRMGFDEAWFEKEYKGDTFLDAVKERLLRGETFKYGNF